MTAFLFLLQGCWGAQEADELGYILVMGIDKGEKNIIKVSFQLAVPQPVEGGKAEKATDVITVEAPSLFGAEELANAFVSKHLTMIHNTAVIVSEEIAREGLSKYINPLVRSRELRRTNYLMVTQGKAADFIKQNKNLIFEKYPSRQFDIFMATAYLTGFIPPADIHGFYKGLKSPGRQPITALVGVQKNEEKKSTEDKKAKDGKNRTTREKIEGGMAYLPGEIPREGGNKIEIIGQAVFKEDRLVGYLNGKETRYYQMLTGDFRRGVFTFPDPQEPEKKIIVVEIKKGRNPDIKVKINKDERTGEGKGQIKVTLFLEGEILSIQSGRNYEQGKLEKELEKELGDFISQEVTELIHKTQVEYASDIFGFGEYTRAHFWTWQDWFAYSWLDEYSQCQISVQTVFNIRRTGMMKKTAPSHPEGAWGK